MLIDRDQVIKAIKQYGKSAIAEGRKSLDAVDDIVKLIRLIRAIPTEDAVPVVRCKDCKQWRRNIGFTDSPNGHCFCIDLDTNQYDFCSCGEKSDSLFGTCGNVRNLEKSTAVTKIR